MTTTAGSEIANKPEHVGSPLRRAVPMAHLPHLCVLRQHFIGGRTK
jgi:hypothetical protein